MRTRASAKTDRPRSRRHRKKNRSAASGGDAPTAQSCWRWFAENTRWRHCCVQQAEATAGSAAKTRGRCLPKGVGRVWMLAGWECCPQKNIWQALVEAAGSGWWPVLSRFSGYTCPSLWRVVAGRSAGGRGDEARQGPNGAQWRGAHDRPRPAQKKKTGLPATSIHHPKAKQVASMAMNVERCYEMSTRTNPSSPPTRRGCNRELSNAGTESGLEWSENARCMV